MCLCEEVRRSNLLVFARCLSLNLLKSLNKCTICTYFEKGIASQMTDCFVVPPRKDTFFLNERLVGSGQSLKLDASCAKFKILFG
jgi:hypothetical protein